MITVLPKAPRQFASRADFDAWAKEQSPGKTIVFVDGLPESVTPRMTITLDANGTAPAPQPKRERTGNADNATFDDRVLTELVASGKGMKAGEIGDKMGEKTTLVSPSLQRLLRRKPPAVAMVSHGNWQAVKAPEQGT